ncbi:hypothetical protein CT0861_01523 [Colletotrichum tofieldiae]|uniref:Uncharacterized protein n=1 Tax=Colletotrichum tofieldiae TaxID=708197 RepID=A0A166PM62_9PEZI|nr:hypothetical protein CT0861_01523 [Colletotrichum tofieldiae]
MPEVDYTNEGYEYVAYAVVTAKDTVFTLRWKGSDKGSIRKGYGVVAQLNVKNDGETVVAIGESVVVDEMWCKK